MSEYIELSEKQEEILSAREPIQFIEASCAVGKTQVLCEKVRRSVHESKITVAFTFTNMAAEEMRQRLGLRNNEQVFIGTIHSYCAKLLAMRGVKAAKKAIEDEEFDKLFELAKQYIAPNPPVIDICLCDETQDSSKTQLEFMFDILHAREYFIMYDTRQSIYRWAGARPELLEQYKQKMNATVFELNENYRNHSEILDFARTLLSEASPPDTSIAMRGKGGRVKFLEYSPEQIVVFLRSAGEWRDWAILARTNTQVEMICEVLREAGIPFDTFKQSDLTKAELTQKMKANTVKVLTIHACVAGDTLVQTSNGIKRIDEIVAKEDYNEQIFDGEKFSSVKRFIDNGKEQTYKITTRFGNTLRATADHDICVLSESGIKKVKTKDLLGTEELLLQKTIPDITNEVLLEQIDKAQMDVRAIIYDTPKTLTPELAELIGLITADGSYNKSSIHYIKNSKECCERFAELIYTLFGKQISVQKASDRDAYIAECNSVYILEFLKKNFDGITPCNKFVSSKILQGNKAIYRSFLRGLFEDGTVHLKNDKFDYICLTFKNDIMKEQLQAMLFNLGIDCVFKKYSCQKNINNIQIYANGAEAFKKIGFITPEKQQRLEKCNPTRSIKNKSSVLLQIIKKYLPQLKMPTTTRNNLRGRTNGTITQYTINMLFEKNKTLFMNTPELKMVYDIFQNYQIEPITTIEKDEIINTYCLEMEGKNDFIQNGFLMGNCKGLEWKYCIATGTRASSVEEKCIAYVAATRAMDGLLWMGAPRKTAKPRVKKPKFDDGLMKW